MRFGGTSSPRRKVGVGGFAVRWAQSRGEWPGSRSTFLEALFAGGSVDIEGAREVLDGLSEADGGARSEEADDGGGRRLVDGFGGIFSDEDFGTGGGGGGINEDGDIRCFSCCDLFSGEAETVVPDIFDIGTSF